LPLSEPAAREHLHTRRITIEGYQRDDGQFDIDCHMADTKTYGFANEDRGFMPPGEPLHGMHLRMTVDRDLVITAFEADMEYTPYTICSNIAPNFARMAGLRIGPGFLRAAAERVGGTHGCTHLRELLQQMATVAFQTTYAVRAERGNQPGVRPALLATCHAFDTASPVVKQRWPEYYTGAN
jgi:hypothetical protein